MGDDGSWHIVTRGDSGVLGTQFALAYHEDLSCIADADQAEIRTASLNSSLVMDTITADVEKNTRMEHVLDDANLDREIGYACDETGELSHLLPSPDKGEMNLEDSQCGLEKASVIPLLPQRERRLPGRYANVGVVVRAKPNFVSIPSLVSSSIDASGPVMENLKSRMKTLLMASAAVSHAEFLRQNPKWSKARIGLDRDKWLQADADEREQQCQVQPGKDGPHMERLLGGKSVIPFGHAVFPIKRVCKIKSSGKYKIRWTVMGNLEHVDEDCFSPTAGKKAVWLMFALAVLKGLCLRFFDIKGAFMAEKPTRDVYVLIDDEYYILRYSLYGLKDAAKVFNAGLVTHLKAGGYVQSQWEQCLFYKKESDMSYSYLVFHVDDFIGSATSERMLDEFKSHMATKYEVTFNTDGIFLGIQMECCKDGSAYAFRKPYQLQNIFDKYMPSGPVMSLPKDPMRESYIKSFDLDDSSPTDTKEFRSMLGAVMQLTDCRPDIAFPIAKIAQRQCSPRIKDQEALLFLLHYLWGTRDVGLILRRGDSATAVSLVRLRGFTDCSFACHGNGKSHYGIGFDLVEDVTHCELNPFSNAVNSGLFYAKSFMAPNVDLSSCQGETCATVELAKDAIFYRGILQELGQRQVQPTPLYGDNDSARSLATHYDGSHKRVRYMLPKINWLMEQTKNEVIKMVRMGTQVLPVDILTKNGRGTEFCQKRDRVMGL